MRCPWMLVVASLAACSDPTAVMIHVLPPDEGPQPTMVRLMIGGAPVNDGQDISISPPQGANAIEQLAFRFRRGAGAWLRDPMDALSSQPISAAEPARFLFKPADGAQLGAVIAVGYDGNLPLQGPLSVAAVFAPQFSDGEIVVYELKLRPAADPSASIANQAAPDQLQLWGPEQSCAYVKSSVPTGGHKEGFLIGSDVDRDCDGLDDDHPLECLSTTYLGARPPRSDELACLETVGIGAEGGGMIEACTIGGSRCVDGEPTDPAQCDQSRYCMPDSVCSICINNPADRWACALEVANDPAYPTSIWCNVLAVPVGIGPPITHELCPGTSVPLPLRPSLIPDVLQCDGVRIRNAHQAFASSLDEPDGATPDDWRFDVDVDTSCHVTLTASGEITTPRDIGGLVAIDLSRMGDPNTNRDLAIPIKFIVIAGTECPPGPSCELKPTPLPPDADQLQACLLADPPRS